MDQQSPLLPSRPAAHILPLGLKSLPNPTVLTVIFGVLLLSVIGVGTAVVLTDKKEVPVVAAPTPTPTPDPTASWQNYISEVYGMKLKIPEGWRIQEGTGNGDTSLYFHSDEVFGNIRYYVYVSSLVNPQESSLSALLRQQYGQDIPLQEEKKGGHTFSLTSSIPARQGALSAFIPSQDHSHFVMLSLTPFDNARPLREQERYETIFKQMLATVEIISSGSAGLRMNIPQGGNSASQSSTLWRVYNDRNYPFSFEYPPEYVLDTSREGRILLQKQIEVIVTPVNPAMCQGVCPVRDKETSVKVGNYSAKKYEGYVTSEGGQTPQRYLQYVFSQNRLYYMFTLYELPADSMLPKDRDPQPIPLEDVQIFDQILHTIRFSR